MNTDIENILIKHRATFHPVVKFSSEKEKLFLLDFTAGNQQLSAADIADTQRLAAYVTKQLQHHHARFGIGGYNENRVLYKRSELFDTLNAPSPVAGVEVSARTIHLGLDIWGPAGTEVFTPLGGMVHSFAFNDHFGDYGATIVLQHQLDTVVFHTLYGHVSLVDIARLQPGRYISRGEKIAHFGQPAENGWWPPHLHFQVIGDMDFNQGDYPGVCTQLESGKYLRNCPDPDLILNLMRFAEPAAE